MKHFNLETKTVYHDFADIPDGERNNVVSRHDWKSLEEAQAVAELFDGYLAIDAGSGVWPRFDVVSMFKIGDKVSYAFNGDYYPDGEITSISETLKVITTSNGNKYYRRGKSGQWKRSGTWSLVSGHHSKLNPHF